jgi:hypothetical protein
MKALTSAVLVAALVLGVVTPSVCGDDGEGKSLRKALLLSMVLPGGGQYYLGNDARAKAMFVSEAGVWAAFTGLRIQGRMRENRYEEMAELFAGVEGGHDDDYYLMMAHYISSEEYNIDVLPPTATSALTRGSGSRPSGCWISDAHARTAAIRTVVPR